MHGLHTSIQLLYETLDPLSWHRVCPSRCHKHSWERSDDLWYVSFKISKYTRFKPHTHTFFISYTYLEPVLTLYWILNNLYNDVGFSLNKYANWYIPITISPMSRQCGVPLRTLRMSMLSKPSAAGDDKRAFFLFLVFFQSWKKNNLNGKKQLSSKMVTIFLFVYNN